MSSTLTNGLLNLVVNPNTGLAYHDNDILTIESQIIQLQTAQAAISVIVNAIPTTYLPLAGGLTTGAIDARNAGVYKFFLSYAGSESEIYRSHIRSDAGTDFTMNGYSYVWEINGVDKMTLLSTLSVGVPIDLNTNKITDVGEPSDPQDAATKYYVDNATILHTDEVTDARGETVIIAGSIDLNNYNTESGTWIFYRDDSTIVNLPTAWVDSWEFTLVVFYQTATRCQQILYNTNDKLIFYRSFVDTFQDWDQICSTALLTSGLSTHTHETLYSAIGHDHDAAYSAIGHNHDAAYSAIGHDHDAAYSAIGHDHDAAYCNITGETSLLDLRSGTTEKIRLSYNGSESSVYCSHLASSGVDLTLNGHTNIDFEIQGGTPKLTITSSAISATLPLSMGSNKITSLTDGVDAQDAVSKAQLDLKEDAHSHPYVPLAGGTMTGDINFDNHAAYYLSSLSFYSATAFMSCSTKLSFVCGSAMCNMSQTGFDVESHKILNLTTGTADSDCTNVGQMNSAISTAISPLYVEGDVLSITGIDSSLNSTSTPGIHMFRYDANQTGMELVCTSGNIWIDMHDSAVDRIASIFWNNSANTLALYNDSASRFEINPTYIKFLLPMDGDANRLTNIGVGIAATDACQKTYIDSADSLALPKTGGSMTGVISMGTNKITGLATGTSDSDACRVDQAMPYSNHLGAFNCNSYTTSQIITIELGAAPSTSLTNGPSGLSGWESSLTVKMCHNSSYGVQEYASFYDGATYRRYYTAGSFGSWVAF